MTNKIKSNKQIQITQSWAVVFCWKTISDISGFFNLFPPFSTFSRQVFVYLSEAGSNLPRLPSLDTFSYTLGKASLHRGIRFRTWNQKMIIYQGFCQILNQSAINCHFIKIAKAYKYASIKGSNCNIFNVRKGESYNTTFEFFFSLLTLQKARD